MRKLGLAIALASTALATPALARDNSWYVGAHGGAVIIEDMDTVVSNRAANSTWNTNTGYDVDGVLGYDFGMFRIEGEVGYRRAWTDVNTYYNAVPVINSTRGNARSLSFMLNGMLDFGKDDGIQAFIGAGAGVARTYLYSLITDDSDTGFAWQAIAGLRYPITNHLDGELKYRYFNHENVDLVTARSFGAVPAGQAFSTDLRSHSILAGLTYNFGGEEAAPPPPPPPPPVAQCTPGPYIVFFEWDRSDVTPDAATILDNAVSAYANCGNAQVMLAGHADKSGSPKYNMGLSERRNTSVRGYLTSKGIPDGVISSEAFGESRPRVETADGVRELQNRRVEITYGPGSGN